METGRQRCMDRSAIILILNNLKTLRNIYIAFPVKATGIKLKLEILQVEKVGVGKKIADIACLRHGAEGYRNAPAAQ